MKQTRNNNDQDLELASELLAGQSSPSEGPDPKTVESYAAVMIILARHHFIDLTPNREIEMLLGLTMCNAIDHPEIDLPKMVFNTDTPYLVALLFDTEQERKTFTLPENDDEDPDEGTTPGQTLALLILEDFSSIIDSNTLEKEIHFPPARLSDALAEFKERYIAMTC